MNQILKDNVYGLGTMEHVEFVAKRGGMNEEELQMLRLIHYGKTDSYIMDSLGITKNAYKKVESSMRRKLIVGIFYCITNTMKIEKDEK